MTTNTLTEFGTANLRPAQIRLPPVEEAVPPELPRSQPDSSPTAQETEMKIRSAKSLDELFLACATSPANPNGYDLLAALDEARQGERPLFPPELKGVTW